MSQDVMNIVSKMSDWYVSSSGAYIRIYGTMKAPHKL